MALLQALVRKGVGDLTVVAYGGPDVGILCATGQARKVVFSFVSLDSIPLEPHFRAARESGAVEVEQYDEGMFLLGLQAAAWNVPFLPTRVGLGSDLFKVNPGLKTIRSPYPSADGEEEELVAMPALPLDVSLLHLNRADERGNAQFLGPDLYMDDLFASAAERTYVSCEKVVPTAELTPFHTLRINRLQVDGVVEAPGGAGFTSCQPDYERDEEAQKAYAVTSRDPDAWTAWVDDWSAA
jgi:glutaconate CoA-transferase subunit A